MNRVYRVLATTLLLSVTSAALAQPGRGGDSSGMADRFFGMMDRNRDGRLDEEETRRIPGPMRDSMQKMGADFRQGISRDRFGEMLPRAMEEMRRGRESGGGYGGSSGRGGPPSYGDRSRGSDTDRGDGRGPSDYGRGDDRSRDSRYGSSSRDKRGPSSRSTPKPAPRVTVDLPEAWKVADLDKDGQIGLYEWDRKKYKEFFALDTNRDSLLTPREISRASGASPTPTATAVATTKIQSSRSTSAPTAKPAGAPIVAAEYDAKSKDGRWAKYVFGRLDKNKDGSLSQDEWNGSVKTRDSFKKHNAQISFPASFESFAGLQVAVSQAERKK